MLKNTLIITLALTLIGCQGSGKKEDTKKSEKKENKEEKSDKADQSGFRHSFYGDTVSTSGEVMTAQELIAKVETQDSVKAKVNTNIVETCSKKGCWMSVEMGDEQPPMQVGFDYKFFVPKSGVEGRNTVFQGVAYRDTLSVATQKHYALDANEDTTGITDPKPVVAFTATGVRIEK